MPNIDVINAGNTAKYEGLVQETQELFDAKLKKNVEEGLEALEKGSWKPFEGFSFEKFDNLETVGIVLSEESKQVMLDRVVTPLTELAKKYGISAVYAGVEDQDPHITLDVAKIDIKDTGKKQEVIDLLHSSKYWLKNLGEIMLNSRYEIDTLVIGAPTIYICSSDVDLSQVYPRKFRDTIEKVWEKVGNESAELGTFGKLYSAYNDIFHISTARIIKKDVDPEVMVRFAHEAYETIGKSLSENPISITTDVVRFVNSAEDLQREILNREENGLHPNLMVGAPQEWVEEQRKVQESRNEPYSRRPCVII